LRGDISAPGFGLTRDQLAALTEQTSHIVHCAASVKLNMPMEQALATAVTPTRTVLELARRGARAGTLRKIDLVSTVGVWGRTPGHMPERRLPEVTDFHNTYEAAKAEAERVVWAEGDGLPITVHRPSMVVGDSRTGRVIHFQVFYHLCEFLTGGRTFGVMPHLGQTKLDTVPVDWVADAICWASRHEETAGRIFHLCSGPQDALALPRLQDRVRDAWQTRGLNLPRLRQVDTRWLQRLVPLIGAVAGAKARRALKALPPVLAYLAEDQGFSNAVSKRAFAAAGLPVPAVEGYLGPVLDFYLESLAARHAS
jgi:thioester reductase-like protein